jgi:hypothetical protein
MQPHDGIVGRVECAWDVFFLYRRTEPNNAPVVPATCAHLRPDAASVVTDVVVHKPTARQFADVQLDELDACTPTYSGAL